MDRKNRNDRSSACRSKIVSSTESPDFIDQTIAVWQPYSDRVLTREDAREITQNVIGFLRVLREWADEERRSTASAETSSRLSGVKSNSS